MKFVFLILFSFIPVVSGYTGIFSILDEKYVDSVNDLPPSNPAPEIVWKDSPGNIDYRWARAWIDIVGFTGMIKNAGIFFINGSVEDAAIVKYDVQGTRGIDVSWKKSVRIYQSGENVIAELTVIRTWYEIFCSQYSCYPVYYSGTMTISDSELAPQQYPKLQSVSANITEFNNSFNPKTVISLNIPGNISKITYRYGSETLTHYLSQGHVEQTAKGVYFLNLSEMDIWTATGNTSLQQLNNMVILPNLSRPDYSQLSIEISNPYETRTIPKENYFYERITYNSGSTFSDPLLMFVSMLATFFILSIIVIRRA